MKPTNLYLITLGHKEHYVAEIVEGVHYSDNALRGAGIRLDAPSKDMNTIPEYFGSPYFEDGDPVLSYMDFIETTYTFRSIDITSVHPANDIEKRIYYLAKQIHEEPNTEVFHGFPLPEKLATYRETKFLIK